MCGRISLNASATTLSSYFNLANLPVQEPHYNLAPGQPILAIRLSQMAEKEATHLHWGFLPAWAKNQNNAYKMINARAETVAEKPTFRAAFKARRCLIPATGFYEWQRNQSDKLPFHIRKMDQGLLAFAGIWESWVDKQAANVMQSCAILTTAANSLIRPIHHRMPVIIPEQKFSDWLHSSDLNQTSLLHPYEWQGFEAYPVSSYVNNARNNSPHCTERLA